MASGILMPWWPEQFCDDNGDPLAAGSLFTYQPGTTTTQLTYSDSALTTPNANPIVLDSAGRAVVYLDPALSYKFILKNSLGATIKTLDSAYTALPGNPGVCQGRLTLTAGTAVTVADVSAAVTAYFTPYKGNQIALYDGSAQWNVRTFSEITISLAGLTASRPYDIFAYDNAGTVTIETLVWTNATTRATALVLQNGVLVKSGVSTRRYLGTIYINSSGGQSDDTFAKRYVFNFDQRALRVLRRLETTGSWTYTTATIRQANGATANQVEVMVGWAGARLQLGLQSASRNTNADILRSVGIGEDSTTTFMAQNLNTGMGDGGGTIAIGAVINHVVRLTHYPAVGLHVYSWNEISAATGTTTWIGTVAPTSGVNASQAGLSGDIDG